jgi:exopolyphosphatase/guanosine-5'-triphosphate,3'-diphosphate pyrophosphatase
MNIAIIDIGSNTFDLLIAEVKPKTRPLELYNTKISVRLGAGGFEQHVLTEASIQRGMEAFIKFKAIIKEYNCTSTFAFATSAVRDAANKSYFVERVKKELQIDIHVISGDKEATYIFLGVQQALDIGHEKALILDIGGGSLEFVIANKHQIFWEASFNLGVARILEKFKISDPITSAQITQIEAYLSQELEPLFNNLKEHPTSTLIGSSGSFDTYAEVIINRFNTSKLLTGATEYTFNLDEYFIIHDQLMLSTLEDRKKIKGIIEMRLDMIVMASLITNFILKKTKISGMRLSTYSLKEGILWDMVKNQKLSF